VGLGKGGVDGGRREAASLPLGSDDGRLRSKGGALRIKNKRRLESQIREGKFVLGFTGAQGEDMCAKLSAEEGGGDLRLQRTGVQSPSKKGVGLKQGEKRGVFLKKLGSGVQVGDGLALEYRCWQKGQQGVISSMEALEKGALGEKQEFAQRVSRSRTSAEEQVFLHGNKRHGGRWARESKGEGLKGPRGRER